MSKAAFTEGREISLVKQISLGMQLAIYLTLINIILFFDNPVSPILILKGQRFLLASIFWVY